MFLKNNWWKALLSIFLIYHVSASLIMPNQRSYIERHFGFLFYPYSSTLGMNTPWQFFSPNPSRNIYYKYEVMYSDPEKDSETYHWPPLKSESSMLGPNHMRLVYHSRFSTSNEERKLYFFANYFCRKHKGAESISLQSFSEEPPSMEKLALYRQPIDELKETKEWPAEQFSCEEAMKLPSPEEVMDGE